MTTKMPSKKAQGLIEDYIESAGSDRAIFGYIAELEAGVESWKKRAAQHGCNVDDGDDDCG